METDEELGFDEGIEKEEEYEVEKILKKKQQVCNIELILTVTGKKHFLFHKMERL